jgi:hypothetical protein
MSHLTDFYRGTSIDSEGRSLDSIWAFNDDEMEYRHDFIQWIFPLTQPSMFNADAPLLTDEDIRAFRDDPLLRENLLRSLDRFLAFLGLSRLAGQIEPGPGFSGKQHLFTIPNHNWLRITRVLHCLRLLGLDEECRQLFHCLEVLAQSHGAHFTRETFRYWKDATFPERQQS